eukprot:1002551-Alexandrium_andersonii.AAC.1
MQVVQMCSSAQAGQKLDATDILLKTALKAVNEVFPEKWDTMLSLLLGSRWMQHVIAVVCAVGLDVQAECVR